MHWQGNRERDKSNIRIQSWVLVVGLILMGVKFLAWWLTNSNAILSDALESIINVVAGSFALFSLYFAAKPKDENHPYGHGKIEFISAGFEGGLILVAGLLMIGKAVYNLIHPQEIHDIDIGLWLTAGSGAINYLLGWILETHGKKHNSLIMVADGKHLKSDAYTSLGLIVGLALILVLGIAWIDNVTAIIFGLVIIFTGYTLMRTSIAGIMDEADVLLIDELLKKLENTRNSNWIDVHNFRLIKYGNTLHIDAHLTLPWYWSLKESHAELTNFEDAVAHCCDDPVELFIHTDPCDPPSACMICEIDNCSKRKGTFQKRIHWTLDNVLSNERHTL